jgi:hypothetical protein
MIGEAHALTFQERAQMLEAAAKAARRAEEMKMILSAAAGVSCLRTLRLVEAHLADDAVKAEAISAYARIAGALREVKPDEALAALRKVLTLTRDPTLCSTTRKEIQLIETAKKARAEMLKEGKVIIDWLVSGPYERQGRGPKELFKIAFPPEAADSKATWQRVRLVSDPARPWKLDLLGAFKRDRSVAYLKTRIKSPKKQDARLELGSDDGVKVWLNGKVVHANNVTRGLVPWSDKAGVVLKEGWNTLQLKVTQNNMGWEACVRLVAPDGSRLNGIEISAE